MLALEEKLRMVVLLMPDLVLEDKVEEIVAKLEENYFEVKARKEFFFSDSEAEAYFGKSEKLKDQLAAASRGLSEVLVLEHLDGDVVERFPKEMLGGLVEAYGESSFCFSLNRWECKRDIEFFFPHLDSLPVERTLAVLKPPAIEMGSKGGKTIEQVLEDEATAVGLFVVGKRYGQLSQAEADVLCQEYTDKEKFAEARQVLTQETGAIAVCLEGRGAIGKLQLICGPMDPSTAAERAGTTIRAFWGLDSCSNAIHASLDMTSAEKEIKTMFPEGKLQMQRTLCIVKPDAITSLVAIKSEIEAAGFTILREKQTTLSEERAKEFYRDLKDHPSYSSIVKEATSGPCCAMALCRLEAINVWKQLMGDPSVKEARKNRPGSIRARFGRDGQRNAVHGSDSVKAGALEIRFFFPEMGADPVPDDDEVRDFLFRKSSVESMDLKTLSDAESTNFATDPSLQQLLAQGLGGLCQQKPKGLDALDWLSDWLADHNPNTSANVLAFDPPQRTKQFLEYGVNSEGMPFVVEAPRVKPAAKPVVEVDPAMLAGEPKEGELSTPPFVVFVAGGPGTGKGTQCKKIEEDFNLVHLSTGDLMREEVAADSALGRQVNEHMQAGTLVPDDIVLALLKKSMMKHQDTNRFLLDGFPRSVDQAIRFEREVAEVAFMLFLDCSHNTMKARITARSKSEPGRVDDNDATVKKRLKVFDDQTLPLVSYYEPIGKLRRADAERDIAEVYAETKKFFSARLIYLTGPLGSPMDQVAERLESKYGYAAINLTTLLKTFAESSAAEAVQVKKAMAAGKPVDASIACPLILSEIYRDMALGVQNFVLCDFPQSLKQAQFLEYRIPSFARTFVLDFSKADASDLAAIAATKGADLLQLEKQQACFFGEETQQMLKAMGGVERIPCSLSDFSTESAEGGLDQQFVEGTWKVVLEKVKPGLTLVMGLPGTQATELAGMLAKRKPNTYAVDCNQLLDKELDRQTETGRAMHDMLAKGQVVPLSMTLELLKGVLNLTSSDSLVVENCPMYVDQIELIEQEFRIDRVYYISGLDKQVMSWKEMFMKAGTDEDPAKTFNERVERLPPIVAHFACLGKLTKLAVNASGKFTTDEFQSMIDGASLPDIAVVSSLSPVLGANLAEKMCSAYGLSSAVTLKSLADWASRVLGVTLDASQPEQLISTLKRFAEMSGLPLLVLHDCPADEASAKALVETIGCPKVVAYVECDEEFLTEEYATLHEGEDDADPEVLANNMQAQRTSSDRMLAAFKEQSQDKVVVIDRKVVSKPDEMFEMVKQKLLPSVYVMLAPAPLANYVAEKICTIDTVYDSGLVSEKYTVLDAMELCKPGNHSIAIENALAKASFNAVTPDCLPAKLWSDLLSEAFARSPRPMGTFLLLNFPTPSSMTGGVTIKDQFAMIESVSTIAGLLHVKVSSDAASLGCLPVDGDFAAYTAFDTAVYDQTLQQFGTSKLLDCTTEDKASESDFSASGVMGLAEKVAWFFLRRWVHTK